MKKKIDIYETIMDHLFKAIVYIAKLTFKQVLSTFKTSLKFKKILNTRTKKIIYCLTIIVTCLFIWVYKLHPVLYFFSPWTYFFFYTLFADLQQIGNKKLNRKYKKVREFFDNKISIVSIKDNCITLYTVELTEKDISSKHSRLELFFNRKISEIRQQEKNLRYIDIYFLSKTKFKAKYHLEQYIEYITKKEISKMILPFVLGLDEKENIQVEDLSKLSHVFVSGESNTGKSCFVNCFIQSLMVFRNSIQFVLVDLKEGIELNDYSKFPNCLIISKDTQFETILKHLESEMIDRLNNIKNASRCKNILQYNETASNKMHYIIIVVDEFATIKLNGNKDLELKLLSILQKGRAAGIYCIGTTQRPAGTQINTDIRAGFLYNISLRVKTPETQRMTKILGTENLQVGEFKTDILPDKTLKSFFIDEKTHNGVFDNLEFHLVHNKEFVIIKDKQEKRQKFYKRLCNYIDTKLYKRRMIDYRMRSDYRQLIKRPLSSIVTEIERIKALYDFTQNNPPFDTFVQSDNYSKFLDFVIRNCKENGELPKSKDIEENIGITRHIRLKYIDRAVNEGKLIRNGKTRVKISVEGDNRGS